jgi:hypothetical protein
MWMPGLLLCLTMAHLVAAAPPAQELLTRFCDAYVAQLEEDQRPDYVQLRAGVPVYTGTVLQLLDDHQEATADTRVLAIRQFRAVPISGQRYSIAVNTADQRLVGILTLGLTGDRWQNGFDSM